ncbi:TPA: hypothetical protein ACNGZA_003731 [Klebsiella michiganensis]
MRSIASGKFSHSALCFPVALRLTGLRVPRRLRAGIPDRLSAPPPGQPE